MADVFISYAREDRDVVRELAHRLTQAGFSVWWDREIAVGADLAQVIESQLDDAKAVIVVWSGAAVRSTWVIGEANVGLDAGKLIPIQIEDASVPLPFRVCETADIRGWPTENNELQLQKILLSVKALVTGEAIDEDDARASNDRLDPTVSVRIANRVAQSLRQSQPSADADILELRVNLETALSNFALELLNEETSRQLLPNFLGNLEPVLRTTYINVWNQSEQIHGWDSRGRELADLLGQQRTLLLSEDRPNTACDDFLATNNLRWACVSRSQEVTLSIGSMYSSSPASQVLNRLDVVCQLIAKHESRHGSGSPGSGDE